MMGRMLRLDLRQGRVPTTEAKSAPILGRGRHQLAVTPGIMPRRSLALAAMVNRVGYGLPRQCGTGTSSTPISSQHRTRKSP